MPVLEHHGVTPEVPASCFIAHDADVIGEVTLGEYASIWFHTVARGDINSISVGAYSNIQDLSMLHVGDDHPCVIGRNVTAGHRVTLHGCTIEDDVLVGMGATVMNGARVGRGSVIAAGAVVVENATIPPFSLVMGLPGKVVRELPEDAALQNRYWAQKYVRVQCTHRGADPPEFDEPVVTPE